MYGFESNVTGKNYELLSVQYPDHMEIKFAEFIEDVVPKYIVMVINDNRKKISHLQVKQIKKNTEFFENKASPSPVNKYL